MTDDIATRNARLIDAIRPWIGSRPLIESAFRAVPRHLFVPPVALAGEDRMTTVINRDADPAAWLNAVYSPMPIVTQLSDGTIPIDSVIDDDGALNLPRGVSYTSSSSAPATVAELLTLAHPEPGHRVLDIGTGTGWTAALLSHLTGPDNVTSVEVDPAVAEQAAKHLSEAGFAPHLIVGDGADGAPDHAPFDRVHVTCGIRDVPYAWVEQTRPGGVIVLPWCPGFGDGNALRLVVMPDGIAHGRFPGFASYMMMRAQRPAAASTSGPEHERVSRVDPRTIAAAPAGADLAISALTGLVATTADLEDGGFRMWVRDPDDGGQWASVTRRPGQDEFRVYQVGDRPVWDEVTDAYFQWVSWGEPGRDRFGMTVTPDGQQVWLDTPHRPIG
ncbi:protein-L-isoaspartate(D-aspartate) O-methyltransferase [Spongiactinospora gelatinilytica]|uniref:Protein-L-isoaspartate O-methyltransferase n=1 Tax=Spongiactinospora gelatinilytica TaxID=2666298 RepID=A0A2W2FQH0_9ACTN|nr:methyltransferase domain-containing protein [Spongiactinospora gelatinilytica]PZG24097.1 protein-L-isoaspartate(D-aspartate) O-methyltransferase [Spongiactinospora gelatinilytica]